MNGEKWCIRVASAGDVEAFRILKRMIHDYSVLRPDIRHLGDCLLSCFLQAWCTGSRMKGEACHPKFDNYIAIYTEIISDPLFYHVVDDYPHKQKHLMDHLNDCYVHTKVEWMRKSLLDLLQLANRVNPDYERYLKVGDCLERTSIFRHKNPCPWQLSRNVIDLAFLYNELPESAKLKAFTYLSCFILARHTNSRGIAQLPNDLLKRLVCVLVA